MITSEIIKYCWMVSSILLVLSGGACFMKFLFDSKHEGVYFWAAVVGTPLWLVFSRVFAECVILFFKIHQELKEKSKSL
jgi:hypothetical protein